MSIEISLIQKTKDGQDRRVVKSFDSGQEAANWYEKQPKANKPTKKRKDERKP